MHTVSANGSPATNIVLPEVHDAADDASGRGQRHYLKLSALRLGSLLAAAVLGAATFSVHRFDLSGLLLLLAFVAAAVAESALIMFQPERDWYSGRAVAESSKTLSWRFAVQGAPFGPDLDEADAEHLLVTRTKEVLTGAQDRIDLPSGPAVVTDSMRTLRTAPLEVRRAAYIEHRTNEQREWYSNNAKKNANRARNWRYALLAGEIMAVVVAAVSLGRDEPVDIAGVVAALVASGAAWLALKQHSQIASAYRIAAAELALQAELLKNVTAEDWPHAVADAEEAISREHTTWLASRGEESLHP